MRLAVVAWLRTTTSGLGTGQYKHASMGVCGGNLHSSFPTTLTGHGGLPSSRHIGRGFWVCGRHLDMFFEYVVFLPVLLYG